MDWDSQGRLSRGVRYLSRVLEHGCDLETPKVVGKEHIKMVDSMYSGTLLEKAFACGPGGD